MTGRRVVLVCGPPCAGKSTYVRERASRDDMVLDHDDLARTAGSPARWRHAQRYRDAAEQQMWAGMEYVATSDDVRAWVIRALPNPDERAEMAAYLRADEVVLLVPDAETLRTRADERGSYGVHAEIARWFARSDRQEVDYG